MYKAEQKTWKEWNKKQIAAENSWVSGKPTSKNGSKTGNHIHSFFPDLNQYTTNERCFLKQLIIEHFVSKENIKNFKIDLSVTQTKKLISLERSKHRNHDGIKYLIRYHSFGESNKIPRKVLDKFNKQVKTQIKEFSYIDLSTSEKPCVSFFEREEFFRVPESSLRWTE